MSSNHNGEFDETVQGRPIKRIRHSTDSTTPRTRAATACERCRARKTKCDNVRPTCAYCSKNGAECSYSDDAISSNLLEAGDRILTAISELKTSIEEDRHHHFTCSTQFSGPTFCRQCRSAQDKPTTSYAADQNKSGVLPCSNTSRLRPEGMEAILQWSILRPFRIATSLVGTTKLSHATSSVIPNLDHRELCRLASQYIDGVHIKNPILDLADLQRDIFHVAEHGLDWSTRTCLVSLVCAIGAVSQQAYDHRLLLQDHTPLSTVSSPSVRVEVEKSLSMQFWSIAVKRIGLVMCEDTVQAVQCLCLAAIWQMHVIQPIQAWKYFNLAGVAWHALNSQNSPEDGSLHSIQHNRSRSFTIMQSLYFTIWKSEGELRMELDVPESILDKVRFPYLFPQPPDLSNSDTPEDDVAEDERSWLYYLADIAIRHLLNRLLCNTPEFSLDEERPLTKPDLVRMLAQADMLEIQLHDWHRSLPAIFSFPVPNEGQEIPHIEQDDRTKVLYYRYLSYRSLLNRPFVQLLVDQTTATSSIEAILLQYPALEIEVFRRSNLCLQYSLLKVSSIPNHRHQGSWYATRTLGASTLILAAVHLATQQGLLTTSRQGLHPPTGWVSKVLEAVATLQEFWQESSGGAPQTRILIGKLMDAVAKAPATPLHFACPS